MDYSNDIELLTEVSWEVCNKVGGIYAVLSTKARVLKEQFADRLVFIGPDLWSKENPSPYFIERKTILKNCSSKMKLPEGISVRCGRWDIPGSPIVILVKYSGMFSCLNEVYGRMWNEFGVDSLHAYGDYDESCAFAVASAIVIKQLAAHLGIAENKVTSHFNEWTTGMGLLYLKSTMPGAATLFTTHATSIGRSICGNGKDLYKYFSNYNGDQMAGELNMEAKHSLEKRAAENADCFTTVSEVTARECEQLLGVKPDVVTPNGFEPDFVPESRQRTALRTKGRKKLLRIASLLSGREFGKDTFIIATSGRNEYRNKGLDLFLDSMAEMKGSRALEGRDTLALVLVPAWMKEPNGDLLVDLKDNGTATVEVDYLTHRLNNEWEDKVASRIATLEREGRIGNGKDMVKVVFVPCYLDGHDGIVDISYYDLLPAVDMSVFPSYYEPWGYTPLESVAFGVPAVTTDKSGFGQWIISSGVNSIATSGVEVIARDDDNYQDAVKSIAEIVGQYECASDSVVRKVRKAAMATSAKADWKYFIAHYDKAFSIADMKRNQRNG